jgi:hypothetical protein
MPVSSTAPGCPGTRADAPGHVAFRIANGVGTRNFCTFTAQWLAYALPCRRFAAVLAGDNARLGASVERYSFTVMDLHHLLCDPCQPMDGPSGRSLGTSARRMWGQPT